MLAFLDVSLDVQVCGPSAKGGRCRWRDLALSSRPASACKFNSLLDSMRTRCCRQCILAVRQMV